MDDSHFYGLAIPGLTQMNSHECGSPLNTGNALICRGQGRRSGKPRWPQH
jgi:hypothetical protein